MDNDDDKKKSKMIQDLRLEYSGQVLDLNRLSDYDRASMTYFTDPKVCRQPRLHITISLNVTRAHIAFVDRAKPGDTFTDYLTWALLATIHRHSYLSWRHIHGVWYAFDDLPLFIPVATGMPGNRLDSVLLKNIAATNWESFSLRYKSAIEQSRRCWSNPFEDQLHWSVYHFIGNLPGIQFTSLMIHESGIETARPIFYFGHRYEDRGNLFVPFTVQFHHATFDPVLLEKFIADFQELLASGRD
jgi:chloramphenicol O-acetyltransferase type A